MVHTKGKFGKGLAQQAKWVCDTFYFGCCVCSAAMVHTKGKFGEGVAQQARLMRGVL